MSASQQALVFPGQGSQREAMASAWVADPAYELWAQADEVLGRDVSRLGVAAPADELREPRNCQVALYVHHAVLFEAWRRSGGRFAVTAGHSLGEYNALLAAGVLTFADGLRLVDARAQATQAAAERRPGGMVACLGGDPAALREACAAAGAHVANDNAPGQLVVAGDEGALSTFGNAAAELGAKVVRLDVGAAYHSPLMHPAVGDFDRALGQARFDDAAVPVVANVDATAHTSAEQWPDLLRRQLTAPVRWRETVMTLVEHGVDSVIELGAAPVLGGMVKRVAPALRRCMVRTPSEAVAA